VLDWEEQLLLEPDLGLIILAFWAVTVFAGAKAVMEGGAMVAEIDLAAKSCDSPGCRPSRGGEKEGFVGRIWRGIQSRADERCPLSRASEIREETVDSLGGNMFGL
jgi:hypothetical protein